MFLTRLYRPEQLLLSRFNAMVLILTTSVYRLYSRLQWRAQLFFMGRCIEWHPHFPREHASARPAVRLRSMASVNSVYFREVTGRYDPGKKNIPLLYNISCKNFFFFSGVNDNLCDFSLEIQSLKHGDLMHGFSRCAPIESHTKKNNVITEYPERIKNVPI